MLPEGDIVSTCRLLSSKKKDTDELFTSFKGFLLIPIQVYLHYCWYRSISLFYCEEITADSSRMVENMDQYLTNKITEVLLHKLLLSSHNKMGQKS